MKLTTIQRAGEEVPAVVLRNGALPLDILPNDYPTGLVSLLKSGRMDELRRDIERLEGSAKGVIPLSEVEYAPLYRNPPKLWGIAA